MSNCCNYFIFVCVLVSLSCLNRIHLEELKRSCAVRVVREVDVAAAIEVVELAVDQEQSIAAILRLTLHPFILVATPVACLQLLVEEGFDRLALEDSIRAFVEFRFQVLEHLSKHTRHTVVDRCREAVTRFILMC